MNGPNNLNSFAGGAAGGSGGGSPGQHHNPGPGGESQDALLALIAALWVLLAHYSVYARMLQNQLRSAQEGMRLLLMNLGLGLGDQLLVPTGQGAPACFSLGDPDLNRPPRWLGQAIVEQAGAAAAPGGDGGPRAGDPRNNRRARNLSSSSSSSETEEAMPLDLAPLQDPRVSSSNDDDSRRRRGDQGPAMN